MEAATSFPSAPTTGATAAEAVRDGSADARPGDDLDAHGAHVKLEREVALLLRRARAIQGRLAGELLVEPHSTPQARLIVPCELVERESLTPPHPGPR